MSNVILVVFFFFFFPQNQISGNLGLPELLVPVGKASTYYVSV